MGINRKSIVRVCILVLAAASFDALADNERYIVQFTNNGVKSAVTTLAAAGATIKLDLALIKAVAAEIPQQTLAELRRHPDIEFIETDPKRFPASLRNTEHVTYGVTAVQADTVAYRGGKMICIIDSGYALGHPDLLNIENITGSNHDAGPWDQDDLQHGTLVAGTIAAIGDNDVGVVGVLPNTNGDVRLHIVRVFKGAGSFSYASDLVAALGECEAAGAEIINMSLSGPLESRTENRAFANAEQRGLLSIAAAGNNGNSEHAYPASYQSVISVAAVDELLRHADFSQSTSQVELSAPGVHVLSSVTVGTGSEASVTAGGISFVGDAIDGAPAGNATGFLQDCGPGMSICTFAEGNICQIQRGDIGFAAKVQACQDGGGDAAIIYNNVEGPLQGSLGDAPITDIPAIGVSAADGAILSTVVGSAAWIKIAESDYKFFDGTSMATPHVAGVAALVWSNFPSCTNLEIRAALARNALDLETAGRDDRTGHGLVQALDTVNDLNRNRCGGDARLTSKD